MTSFRKKYTLLLVGLPIFVTTVVIFLHPRYVRTKAKLTHEFELTVKGASLSFNESITRHLDNIDYQLYNAVSRLQKTLIGQAEELDGYLSRISQGESEVTKIVSHIFEAAYKENIYPAIFDFRESYEEELSRLEDGLLIRLNDSFSLDCLQNQFIELEKSALKITNILRSPKGLIIKVCDDAFEWVPIAGDAWGFLKIVYDPRKENIENKIVEVTKALRISLKQQFSKYRMLTASHIERVCRNTFKGNYAVMKYLYLTYLRR